MREPGGDLMIFSPRAPGMEHHVPDRNIARVWARACNDLVHRVTQLYPQHFAAACQSPQTPDGSLDRSIAGRSVASIRRPASTGTTPSDTSTLRRSATRPAARSSS
jgi:hypothetical protein